MELLDAALPQNVPFKVFNLRIPFSSHLFPVQGERWSCHPQVPNLLSAHSQGRVHDVLPIQLIPDPYPLHLGGQGSSACTVQMPKDKAPI